MSIIDENSSATLTHALKLIDKTGEDFSAYKIRGLGLKVALLGVAEIQALRLSTLAVQVHQIEERLFSDKNYREMDTKTLMSLYKTSVNSMNDSTSYLAQIVGTTKWKELEADLTQLAIADAQSKNDEVSKELSQTAEDLLDKLSEIDAAKKALAGQDSNPTEEDEAGFYKMQDEESE